MLNSYIFVFRKQNATRNCNVLFEFLYFGFLDPPTPHILPSSSWTRRPTSRKPSAKPTLIFLVGNPTLWHALSSLGIWGLRQTRIWFGPLTPDHLGSSSIQCQEWPGEFQDMVENFYVAQKIKFAANTSNWGRCPIILKSQSLEIPVARIWNSAKYLLLCSIYLKALFELMWIPWIQSNIRTLVWVALQSPPLCRDSRLLIVRFDSAL